MYVYWYVSKFCLPQLTFPQTNVAIFSSREQCTSREVSYYNKSYTEKAKLNKLLLI